MIKRKSIYNHEYFMERCLELALNGLGNVEPNPMVGAVLLFEDQIIGEGYHQGYGLPHAEVNAINAVKDQSLLKKSTLYVNLEPCAHMGKTPPCTDLIIEKKIPKVVIGTSDPNSLVAGKGIEKLQKAGVEVINQVLPEKCNELNKRFFTYHEKKRPYVILKWAQTSDGFMDVIRKPGDKVGVNWISNTLSRKLVHRWRSEEQGILAGTDTIMYDDPELTLRLWKGTTPVRIIIDRNLRIPATAKVYNSAAPTLIFNTKISKMSENIEFILFDNGNDTFSQVLDELYKRSILSIMVEGGKKILEYLIDNNLWDEARVFEGEKKFGDGLKAPVIKEKSGKTEKILTDTLFVYRNI